MKILVCVSNVPDTTTKITFSSDMKSFNTAGVQFIINPDDELALTKALELKESLGGEVTVINVGDASTEPNIRKALAIGADNAVRINTLATDAFTVANEIANYAKTQNFDLIFTGRESIDYNGGQVGGMIAELLDIPHVNVIASINFEGNVATMERDIDGGREVVKVSSPLLVSAQKDLCEPRIPNMRGIMSARTKPLQVVEPAGNEQRTVIDMYENPAQKQAVKFIDANNMDELVSLLHNNSKVI